MSAHDLLPQIPRDRLVIPLAEVAALTGWSERSLLDDCRAGAIDHTNRKGTYGFTPEQVDTLIRRHVVVATADTRSAADRQADEVEAARLANAERMSARGRGRAA